MNKKSQFLLKRSFDIIFSLIFIILFLPLWMIIALLIKITSSGPIFFIQRRPGKNKKIFKIYKYRTMKPGSEKMIKGLEVLNNDSRITIVGKILRRSKIDEIPQLLNVLKGEMSLVGPRPERIESLKDYNEEISKRLYMRPGITGLAQVSGNIYLDLNDRYKYDVYYVENYNIILDFKIIIRTIVVVIFGEERFLKKTIINVYDDFELILHGVEK